MPAVDFTSPAGGGPASVTPRCSGWSTVSESMPVGVDHQRDVARLHRDLHVVEADLGEVRELALRRRDERLGGDAAVRLGDVGVEAAGVHADADREAAVLGLLRDGLDLRGLADVAGVEPQALHPRLHRREREAVLEVDVGDDRHRRAGHDLREALGRGLLVARAAHDVAPGRGEGVDLAERAVDVGRLRGRHRLHRDRRVAADGDTRSGRASHHHLAGHTAGIGHRLGAYAGPLPVRAPWAATFTASAHRPVGTPVDRHGTAGTRRPRAPMHRVGDTGSPASGTYPACPGRCTGPGRILDESRWTDRAPRPGQRLRRSR